MALVKIPFQPGIHKEGTQYSAGPTWFDCDKIRFRQGRPEQIGGWTKYISDPFLGVCRSIFDWATADNDLYLGLGTNLKFYVENGGTYFDVTPIRETTAAGDVTFSASDGDETLTVTDTAHGAAAGDYVTFSGAVTLGGLITAAVLNQEYEIATVVDSNSYTVEAKDTGGSPVTANASDTGNGGASVVGAYQINTGTNSFVPSVGYGVDTWGTVPWGGGGSLSVSGQLRLYSQDEFGDDLIFNPRVGAVYYWDESVGTGTRAVDLSALPGASDTPTTCLQVMVSPNDRHVICFGVNDLGSAILDPLLVRWSDQESAADWTPTATNSAGGQVLSTGSIIIGAVKTRQEILIFTDTSIHTMRFSGAPFVFRFNEISQNVSLIGPNAAASVGNYVYFMDNGGFYVYRGAVERIPCTVLNYVFSDIDSTQFYKIFASYNPDDNEVWWFYPSDTGSGDIDRYVIYNYMENLWSIGNLGRAAWAQAPTKSNPIASSNDTANPKVNYLYSHEFGYDADGADIAPYIESGEFTIGDMSSETPGEFLAFMRRFIPDFQYYGTANNASFTIDIKGRDFPQDTLTTLDTATVINSTKQSHVRVRARDVAIRITGSNNGYGWTMGDFRFDLRTDGRR